MQLSETPENSSLSDQTLKTQKQKHACFLMLVTCDFTNVQTLDPLNTRAFRLTFNPLCHPDASRLLGSLHMHELKSERP